MIAKYVRLKKYLEFQRECSEPTLKHAKDYLGEKVIEHFYELHQYILQEIGMDERQIQLIEEYIYNQRLGEPANDEAFILHLMETV